MSVLMERQEARCIVNETNHGMKFYRKVLALYTSLSTERRVHFSIKGVNYIFRATLHTLTYFYISLCENYFHTTGQSD